MRWRRLSFSLRSLLIAVLLVAAVFSIPVHVEYCPAWHVRVSDESRQPLKGQLIYRHWTDQNGRRRFDAALTDVSGKVSFPKELIRLNLFHRLFMAAPQSDHFVHVFGRGLIAVADKTYVLNRGGEYHVWFMGHSIYSTAYWRLDDEGSD
ncbi:MAG TPA: hypothetical protein VEK08_12150 [Planctomycetota bacterium]|nr:hypothetical protein [Planctomycetota bacterium]